MRVLLFMGQSDNDSRLLLFSFVLSQLFAAARCSNEKIDNGLLFGVVPFIVVRMDCLFLYHPSDSQYHGHHQDS